jgi:predicted RNA binding protein YcfA (HicA-like mRNA interferase family)
VSDKLPSVSGKQVVAALERDGFVHVKTKGSHAKLRHADRALTVIVPLHRELAKGTLRSILRQANLTVDRLLELL